MSELSREYASAIDHLEEKEAEYEFLRYAGNAFIFGSRGSMSTSEYRRQLDAQRRLIDAAWKATFDAARKKEAAEMKLNMEWATSL